MTLTQVGKKGDDKKSTIILEISKDRVDILI